MEKIQLPNGIYAIPAEDNWKFYRPDGGIMFELPDGWGSWFCDSMNAPAEELARVKAQLEVTREALERCESRMKGNPIWDSEDAGPCKTLQMVRDALLNISQPTDMNCKLKELINTIPQSFIDAFMESRAWTAAKDINVQSRKDAVERWLEADWLKVFVPKVAALKASE